MKFVAVLLFSAGCALTLKATPFCTVSPGVWCEKGAGDAGSLPATSETTIGTGTLNSIIGDLSDGTGGADMYSIYIADPSTFSANFDGDGNGGVTPLADAALYLYDSTGHGIEAADDSTPALGAFTGPAGIYYIAIAPNGNNPQYKTGGNSFLIFSAFNNSADSTPVAGAGAIANYSKNGCGANCEGGYDISLSGANYSNLPEPASVLLTLLGLGTLSLRRKGFFL
jgi:hypothetical protein